MQLVQDEAPKICFICGARRRTGTNFLYQLLVKHPKCAHPGEVEDYILHYSDLLELFADQTYMVWTDDLQPVGNKARADVLRSLGHALELFLVEQSKNYGSTTEAPQAVVTKTPSAVGIQRLPRLCPTSRAIVLVRDGRAVVESSRRTWGWGIDFDAEAKAWAASVRTILALPKPEAPDWWLLVRYEDLVSNTENELRRIFEFLELEAEEYDFAQIHSQAVIGSSQFRTGATQATAVRRQAPSDFAPLERYKHWPRRRHWRFNWIAGSDLQKLDYRICHPMKGFNGAQYVTYNLVLDAFSILRRPLRAGALGLQRRTGIVKYMLPAAASKIRRRLRSSDVKARM